jgi:hypothetical protein
MIARGKGRLFRLTVSPEAARKRHTLDFREHFLARSSGRGLGIIFISLVFEDEKDLDLRR